MMANPADKIGLNGFACIFCKSRFSSWSDLFNHLYKSEYGIDLFMCVRCSAVFLNSAALEKHNEISCHDQRLKNSASDLHILSNVVVCGECGEHVALLKGGSNSMKSNYDKFLRHSSKKFHKFSIYSVAVGENFKLPPKIQVHFTAPLISIPLKCHLCKHRTPSIDDIDRHMVFFHRTNVTSKSCTTCGSLSFTDFSYRLHQNLEHSTTKWNLLDLFEIYSDSKMNKNQQFQAVKQKQNSSKVDFLTCDLCLLILPLKEFNEHDCAVDFTRRLEVEGTIVKCPSVILKPLKICIDSKNDTSKYEKLRKSVEDTFKKQATIALNFSDPINLPFLDEFSDNKLRCCRYCDILFNKNHVTNIKKHIKDVHKLKRDKNLENSDEELLRSHSDVIEITSRGLICPKFNCQIPLCSLSAMKRHLKFDHMDEILHPVSSKKVSKSKSEVGKKVPECENTSGSSNLSINKSSSTDKVQISNVVSLARDSSTKKINPKKQGGNSASHISPISGTTTLLLHPPPLPNMKPGIYNFISAQQECKMNEAATSDNPLLNSMVGIFMQSAQPEIMYLMTGGQVSTYANVAKNGKTNFAIGGIPANFKLPENLKLPSLNELTEPDSDETTSSTLEMGQSLSHDQSLEVYQWECPVCSVQSTSLQFLRNHLKQNHFYLCSTCGGCFVTLEFKQKHKNCIGHLSPTALFFCFKCNQAFPILKYYYDHLIDFHQADVTFDENNGQVFPSSGVLQSCNVDSELSIKNTVDEIIGKTKKNDISNNNTSEMTQIQEKTAQKRKGDDDRNDEVMRNSPKRLALCEHDLEIIDLDVSQDDISEPPVLPMEISHAEEKQQPRNDQPRVNNSVVEPQETAKALEDGVSIINENKFGALVEDITSSESCSNDLNSTVDSQIKTSEQEKVQTPVTSQECSVEDAEIQIEKILKPENTSGQKQEDAEPQITVIDDDIQIVSASDDAGSTTSKPVKREVHICHVCSRSFCTLRAVQEHSKTHAFDAGATCEQTFAVPSSTDVFVCRVCCLAYENSKTFEKHTKRHGLFYGCLRCNSVCFDNKIASDHAAAHESLKIVFGCALCRHAFRAELPLMLHMHNEHGLAVLWMCQKCSRANTDWATMVAHAGAIHKNEPGDPTNYIVPCPQSKLHYQPDNEAQYAASLQNINNQTDNQPPTSADHVIAAECVHRTFSSYSEPVVCCPTCGSMIPAMKYLLENENMRKQGQFKLLLVDENTEKREQNRHPANSPVVKRPQIAQTQLQQKLSLNPISSAPAVSVSSSSISVRAAMLNKPLATVAPNLASLIQGPQPSPPMSSLTSFDMSAVPSTSTSTGSSFPSTGGNNVCRTCLQTLPTAAALKVHKMKHNSEHLIFCLECGFSAKTLNSFFGHTFDNHGHRLSGAANCACEICGETMSSLAAYKQHLHAGQRCETCLLPVTPDEHEVHVRRHIEHGKFCCVFCGAFFGAQRELNIHEVKHVCDSWVMCRECGMCYRQVEALINHFQGSHFDLSKASKPICVPCRKPAQKTPWFHILADHMVFSVRMKADVILDSKMRRKNVLDGPKTYDQAKFKEVYVCRFCSMPLFNAHVARTHARNLHDKSIFWTILVPNDLLSMSPRNTCYCFYCPCNAPFMALPEHLKIRHPGEGPYFCRSCDDIFDNSFDLTYHEQFNHLGNPASLTDGQQAPLPVTLTQLQRNPSFSPIYCPLCGICVQDFSFPNHLTSHKLPNMPSGFLSLDICAICGICFKGKDYNSISMHAMLHRTSLRGNNAAQSHVFFCFRVFSSGPASCSQPPCCTLCDEILTWNAPHLVQHYLTQHTPKETATSLQNYHAFHAHLVAQGRLICRMCNFLAPFEE